MQVLKQESKPAPASLFPECIQPPAHGSETSSLPSGDAPPQPPRHGQRLGAAVAPGKASSVSVSKARYLQPPLSDAGLESWGAPRETAALRPSGGSARLEGCGYPESPPSGPISPQCFPRVQGRRRTRLPLATGLP